jgi:quinoprotein glucose dehydrogenase
MSRALPLRSLISAAVLYAITAGAPSAEAQSTVPDGEWHAFGRDGANTKYSPLAQITADNFADLEVAWRWTSLSRPVVEQYERIRPGSFKAAPLMADGLVYVSTALGQAAALDAGTGDTVWTYDPRIYDYMDRPPNVGWHHRGLSYWKDDESDDARIFMSNHDLKLVALNARTGALYPDFGDNGYVDLTQGYGREIDASRMTYSSPVAVAGDTIITGSIIQDTNIRDREASPGDVRAYDARTGEMKWIFHTIPRGDEFGVDSWQNESWRYSGHTNVWSYMAVDEELGLVYLPTGTPSNDWYGGMRPGNNLFAESIVAVDIETGYRMWHFQAVHHGLWDWDFPTGPNLLDITVDGRKVKALAQVSKQAFTYVFDRVTGEPIWPIEERPVPQGSVPGEWYSPTQPFPTKPPPFDRQGISIDDIIDFTPELRAEALELIADRARFGPIFSPPVLRGTEMPYIQVPGAGGGANWQGAAVDPTTGRLFVSSSSTLIVVEVIKYDAPATIGYFTDPWGVGLPGPQGLSVFKPPYKRVTALNLNTGDRAWMQPHGDGPRNHPALEHLDLPPLGGGGGISSGPLVTPTLLIMNHGGRDYDDVVASSRTISAYDKDTGRHLGAIDLPAVPNGNPVTYLHDGKQYLVVATGSGGTDSELVALTLPE